MSHLALFLLGPPRIERDDEPIEVDRRKAVALLAYVAVTAERHSRDVLATLLWQEYDQAAARAALGTTLWALNKALGKGWLEVDRETVGLSESASIWVDVTRFRHLVAECRAHGHPPDKVCPACVAPLTEAVELYQQAIATEGEYDKYREWREFAEEWLRVLQKTDEEVD